MNQINLDIIKKFKEAFSYDKDFQQSDVEKYFNEEMIDNCKDIKWLYWSQEQAYSLIGIDEDGNVSALQDEGELIDVCEGLENIPYEMLRILSDSGKDGSLEDIMKYNQNILIDLLKYEEWCRENNVELDKNKVYHDDNGKLFDKYFEKD